ncbi:hypothetical protein QVD17_16148 [Tagetes erecta]|uniref:Uncharacterized protein n=1 Tax=Tagetes erecta TaxID=13708 RepID=A0AAD8KQY1_TARER|nr:hypothetical protein QVD17_16148 [Tagetes erecta]
MFAVCGPHLQTSAEEEVLVVLVTGESSILEKGCYAGSVVFPECGFGNGNTERHRYVLPRQRGIATSGFARDEDLKNLTTYLNPKSLDEDETVSGGGYGREFNLRCTIIASQSSSDDSATTIRKFITLISNI